MDIKEFWHKTNDWFVSRSKSNKQTYKPQIDNEGLLHQDPEPKQQLDSAEGSGNFQIKKAELKNRAETIEKLETNFNRLIDQLGGINVHLKDQVGQHEHLVSELEKMPALLENFPAVAAGQQKVTEELIEQLKKLAAKDQQFIETVEKIPLETSKQTDALVNINHQLAAAADIDVQMSENFARFYSAVEKLNATSANQNDSILQMSKTFATSDRYLKYLMTKHNRRFLWIFAISLGVCLFSILTLAVIVIYLIK
ncbi:MAG: hypothetical protein H8D47_04835 [Planctomycetes bacterium]|nr:hypothetical protein [Planctomycetota bacterium]MBL7107195.1 hypothetical protein [Phycisphaerae bacterium]